MINISTKKMSNEERLQTVDKFREFQIQAKKARVAASTYVDLQEGDSIVVEVLIEKGATIQEFEGQKGKYSKVKYMVIDLETGRTLELLLTAKQSGKADEEMEKLILRGLRPILKIKKIDSRTLDIERVQEQNVTS